MGKKRVYSKIKIERSYANETLRNQELAYTCLACLSIGNDTVQFQSKCDD